MTILKKSLLTFFAFIILSTGSLTLFASSAHAQWYKPSFPNFVALVESPNETELFGERYTAAQVSWIIHSLVYFILPDAITCVMGNISDPAAMGLECGPELVLLFASAETTTNQSSSIASVLDRPLSSTTYFKIVGERLKMIPEVQAQGFGFESGAVIFTLWEASRNVAYSLLIIVIVIMAFMIMFRVKLSPQTVISVQSALPKVIVTLILITFSYAIAGLLIDLMYVGIGLLTTILIDSCLVGGDNCNSITWGQLFVELTTENGAFGLMMKYWLMFILALMMAMSTNILGALGTLVGATPALTAIITIVMFVVVMILGFKIWWMLLKNFVMIILSIAFGPFQILFGALGSGGFGPWAKNLAGLLAVYPVVGFMFVLAFIFLRGAMSNIISDAVWSALASAGLDISNLWPFDVSNMLAGNASWVPPLTSGTNDLDLAWLGVSIAIVALIPKAADMIKGFMTGRPLAYGTAIGEGLAFASGVASGAANTGVGAGKLKFAQYAGAKAGGGGGVPPSKAWKFISDYTKNNRWGP